MFAGRRILGQRDVGVRFGTNGDILLVYLHAYQALIINAYNPYVSHITIKISP